MVRRRALVVDDEEGILEVVADTLCVLEDTEIVVEQDSSKAAELLSRQRFDLLITDIRMPKVGGLELLQVARRESPDTWVLMMTAYPTVETAVESIKLGAVDYITKPFIPDDLLATVKRTLTEMDLRQENQLLQRHIEREYVFDDIIGACPAMRKVFETISSVADTDVDVLITGATGTGKELVARSIHKRSPRSNKRFMPVDCGAIPEMLMESEFFGHERGAFTGAGARSLGILELADGGTFFLDEVAELPLQLQAKLLRVLQERSFRRVGGKEEISVDVRVIAATNRDLIHEVQAGNFREDLYYRIDVARIEIPALINRGEDLPLLIRHFFGKYADQMGKKELELAPELVEILSRYPWPGNIRELQNVLKRIISMTRKEVLSADDLSDEIVMRASGPSSTGGVGFFKSRSDHMAAFEKDYLAKILRDSGGNVSRAARKADLPRGTLHRLLKKHGLSPDRFRA